MSIRNRTTKLIARRHDLNYFKRMSPLRAWQWYLAGAALVCAVAWFATSTLAHGDVAFSSGPISSSHAVFGQRCELCHVPVIKATSFTPSFGFRKGVPDSACLSCHNAAPHHPMESAANPTCSSCHREHIGSTHLANTADVGCTQCHAKLESRTGALRVASSVNNFATDHPDFRALRTASAAERDADFGLRFNHAEHMKPGLSGPHGGVNLGCQSCHSPTLTADHRDGPGLAPVDFDKSCRSCHSLEFDRHITQEAPHERPEVVRAFVAQQVSGYAQAHPDVVSAEIRNWPTEALLPGHMRLPAPHSTQEWIANRTASAEIILWREKCALCHKDLSRTGDTSTAPQMLPVVASLESVTLPQIQPFNQPEHWYKAAVFSHPAHQAVQCAECHTAALTSSSGKDLLMPTIATCRRCHDGQSSPQGPPVKVGHAESGCFLCHVYHGDDTKALAAAHSVAEIAGR